MPLTHCPQWRALTHCSFCSPIESLDRSSRINLHSRKNLPALSHDYRPKNHTSCLPPSSLTILDPYMSAMRVMPHFPYQPHFLTASLFSHHSGAIHVSYESDAPFSIPTTLPACLPHLSSFWIHTCQL